jgi:hypothetical protein
MHLVVKQLLHLQFFIAKNIPICYIVGTKRTTAHKVVDRIQSRKIHPAWSKSWGGFSM